MRIHLRTPGHGHYTVGGGSEGMGLQDLPYEEDIQSARLIITPEVIGKGRFAQVFKGRVIETDDQSDDLGNISFQAQGLPTSGGNSINAAPGRWSDESHHVRRDQSLGAHAKQTASSGFSRPSSSDSETFRNLGPMKTRPASSLPRRVPPGTLLAVKKVQVNAGMSAKTREKCFNEARLLQSLNHPNIVACYDSYYDEALGDLVLVLEMLDGGDLKTLIEKVRNLTRKFSERQVWRYIRDLSSALMHMHSRRILHRDIKPANILLAKTGVVKLADFGLGRHVQGEGSFNAVTKVGTPLYMPPEVTRGERYGPPAEVYSLGAVAWEICMLQPAFKPVKGMNLVTLFEMIQNGQVKPIPPSTGYSSDLTNLIAQMMNTDPAKRPSLDYIYGLASRKYDELTAEKSRREGKTESKTGSPPIPESGSSSQEKQSVSSSDASRNPEGCSPATAGRNEDQPTATNPVDKPLQEKSDLSPTKIESTSPSSDTVPISSHGVHPGHATNSISHQPTTLATLDEIHPPSSEPKCPDREAEPVEAAKSTTPYSNVVNYPNGRPDRSASLISPIHPLDARVHDARLAKFRADRSTESSMLLLPKVSSPPPAAILPVNDEGRQHVISPPDKSCGPIPADSVPHAELTSLRVLAAVPPATVRVQVPKAQPKVPPLRLNDLLHVEGLNHGTSKPATVLSAAGQSMISGQSHSSSHPVPRHHVGNESEARNGSSPPRTTSPFEVAEEDKSKHNGMKQSAPLSVKSGYTQDTPSMHASPSTNEFTPRSPGRIGQAQFDLPDATPRGRVLKSCRSALAIGAAAAAMARPHSNEQAEITQHSDSTSSPGFSGGRAIIWPNHQLIRAIATKSTHEKRSQFDIMVESLPKIVFICLRLLNLPSVSPKLASTLHAVLPELYERYFPIDGTPIPQSQVLSEDHALSASVVGATPRLHPSLPERGAQTMPLTGLAILLGQFIVQQAYPALPQHILPLTPLSVGTLDYVHQALTCQPGTDHDGSQYLTSIRIHRAFSDLVRVLSQLPNDPLTLEGSTVTPAALDDITPPVAPPSDPKPSRAQLDLGNFRRRLHPGARVLKVGQGGPPPPPPRLRPTPPASIEKVPMDSDQISKPSPAHNSITQTAQPAGMNAPSEAALTTGTDDGTTKQTKQASQQPSRLAIAASVSSSLTSSIDFLVWCRQSDLLQHLTALHATEVWTLLGLLAVRALGRMAIRERLLNPPCDSDAARKSSVVTPRVVTTKDLEPSYSSVRPSPLQQLNLNTSPSRPSHVPPPVPSRLAPNSLSSQSYLRPRNASAYVHSSNLATSQPAQHDTLPMSSKGAQVISDGSNVQPWTKMYSQ